MTEQATGLIGAAALIPDGQKYLHNQRIGLVTDLDESSLDKGFLFHLFNSHPIRKQLHTSASGTKVRHSSPERINAARFLKPPIDEQRRIADILFSWDRTISLTERLIAAKLTLRKGLMQQLLTGKRRFPGFVKSTEMRDTRWGQYPIDWDYPSIGEIARSAGEINRADESLPVLSCTKHRGLVDSLEYFGKQVYSKDLSTYKVVQRGQFAYATNHIEEGSIGYQDLYERALISPMYSVFETGDLVDDRFLYLVFKTELYRHIFEANTSASVDRRGSLRWGDFSRIHVPIPSLDEQRAIVGVFEILDRELSLLRAQLAALKTQKRGLMKQLLTGKVRVTVTEAATRTDLAAKTSRS